MMGVQLALYKGRGGFGNAAIRWWTRSPYSHCELVVDGYCYSSSVMDRGVRRKRIGPGDEEISLGEHWDLIALPWADPAAVLAYFDKTDPDRYGWPSLIASQLFNRNRQVEHAAFCSEWCAAAVGLPAPASYSPATLGAIASWLHDAARTTEGIMGTSEGDRKTLREALDELSAMGFEEEVSHVRSRMNEAQTDFVTRLTGKDFPPLKAPTAPE